MAAGENQKPQFRHLEPQFRPFTIVVKIEGRPRRLNVIQTLQGLTEDRFKVAARNKTLVFSTNRPIIDRRGLKDFPYTWKLVEGQLHNQSARNVIIKTIEAHLRGKPLPPSGFFRE